MIRCGIIGSGMMGREHIRNIFVIGVAAHRSIDERRPIELAEQGV